MLPEDCKKKILAMADADNIAQGFVDIFTAVANEATTKGDPAGTLVVPMYDENSGLKPGDFAAELHFVVRKVE